MYIHIILKVGGIMMSFFGFTEIDKLSAIDLAIYRYLVEHDDQIHLMRVRDIADNAHVSNSSVMRFIRKIGYNSFPEFRISFQHEHLQKADDNPDNIQLITAGTFPPDIENTIKLVAHKLLTADNIVFIGMGASGAIAEYATRQTSSIGFNSYAVKDPFYPLLPQLKNSTNNVLITLSVSGKTSELVEMLNNFVNDPDTDLISITSNIESPIARMGHYSLTYQINKTKIHKFYDLTSQVPCLSIVEALLSELRKQEIAQQLN